MKFKVFRILIAAALLSSCTFEVESPISTDSSTENKDDVIVDNESVVEFETITSCDLENEGDVLKNVKQITTGDAHTCALLENGKVACWGGSSWNGVISNKATCINELSDSIAIDSNGGYELCSVISDGSIKCAYGINGYVVKIPQIDNAISVNVGDDNCAILDNGDVKCWGYRFDSKMILNPSSINPVVVPSFKNAKQISTSSSKTCAIMNDNSISCIWYDNGYTDDVELKNIKNLPNDFKQIAYKMGSVICAINDTNAYCGHPYILNKVFSEPTPINYISVGAHMNCIIDSDKKVRCSRQPEQMSEFNTVVVDGVENAIQVSTSGYNNGEIEYTHACALIENGTVQCWGDNMFGQLGNGSNEFSFEPVYVKTN